MSVSFFNMLELLEKNKKKQIERENSIINSNEKNDKKIKYYINKCLDLNDRNIYSFECEYLRKIIFDDR